MVLARPAPLKVAAHPKELGLPPTLAGLLGPDEGRRSLLDLIMKKSQDDMLVAKVAQFAGHMPFHAWLRGGYLRLFPLSLVERMTRRVLRDDRPVIFYVHPSEIDPGQPRIINEAFAAAPGSGPPRIGIRRIEHTNP